MILADEDAALFYRAWGALLTWVNDQRKIVPPFPLPTAGNPIDPMLATKIRDVVWAVDALRKQFLSENPANLGTAERELVASWKERVRGRFVILQHLQKHSIFMGDAVYGVRGIYSPLAMMFSYVPIFVEATLIPFRDVIITDGLMQSFGMQITFGAGARRAFKEQYNAARVAGRVRTRLPWHDDPQLTLPEPRPTARKKSSRRAPRSRPVRPHRF